MESDCVFAASRWLALIGSHSPAAAFQQSSCTAVHWWLIDVDSGGVLSPAFVWSTCCISRDKFGPLCSLESQAYFRRTALSLLFLLFLLLPNISWLLCRRSSLWCDVKRSDALLFQARFLVPVQETNQSRRVVVSHNVDKALKEGNGRDFHMSLIMQILLETVSGQHCRVQNIVWTLKQTLKH